MINTILDTDSYKTSHFLQYPPGTDYMYSYLESRGGRYDYTLFFGLQFILKDLEKTITEEMVYEAAEFCKAHGVPFPFDGWMKVVKVHKGKLPIKIKAVPEGTVVSTKNILMSVESTDPELFWIVSWLETQLLRVWYPITVATQSFYIKRRIKEFLDRTSDNGDAELPFKLHDFGARGVSSSESAAIGGAAHLVNFRGSDTIAGVIAANRVYADPMAGFSIPASEHSTITSWGRANEASAYANMIRQFSRPGSIYAVVSDSYNIYKACEHLWGEELKERVIAGGGTLVIRPDSGDPACVVPKILEILAHQFGFTVNSKNYKVLPPYLRVIQGDGVNADSILDILVAVTKAGFSTSNIAFGMGGALLQQVNRDTQRFAIKCSAIHVRGEYDVREVYKSPMTDAGKASKKGILSLQRDGNKFYTVQSADSGVLETVFENGQILKKYSLSEVRERADSFLNVDNF